MQKNRFAKTFAALIIYLIFLAAMIGVIELKANFHVDEIYSYGLSNHQDGIDITFEEGKKYEPASIPFLNYLSVDPEHRFDYKNVYINQANDVHPPLYYAFLHTICSFFPGKFSKWYAGAINIVFGLATLFMLRKLMRLYCGNETLVNILSFGFAISSGVLLNVSFLRMYVMAMFWVTTLCYLYISHISKKLSIRFCLAVFMVVFLGAMTHYYNIVYAVLLTAVFVLYQLFSRQWKNAVALSVSTVLSGVFSVAFFRYMIDHMFHGYRGTEAIDNLSNKSDIVFRLKAFYSYFDDQLFGSFLEIIIALAIISVAAEYILQKREKAQPLIQSAVENDTETPELDKEETDAGFGVRYLILIVPIVIYYLLVSKMTPFERDRYVFPIYGIAYLAGILLMVRTLARWMRPKRYLLAVWAFVMVIAVGTLIHGSWEYLYLNTKDELNRVAQYSDNDCICLYECNWKVHLKALDGMKFRNITFVQIENYPLLEEVLKQQEGSFVLSLVGICDIEKLKSICEKHYSDLGYSVTMTEIGSFEYGENNYVEITNAN